MRLGPVKYDLEPWHVSVFKIDPGTGEKLGRLVDVTEPIIVRAGEAFIALLDAVIASDTGRPSGQR
jgi:hypothetical protein